MQTTDPAVFSYYVAYLVLAVGLTAGLGFALYRTGASFMREAFTDRPSFADTMNRVVVVGFTVIGLGIGMFLMPLDPSTANAEIFGLLARKLGFLLIVLGGMYLTNTAIVNGMRRRKMEPRIVTAQAYPLNAAQAAYVGSPAQQWADYSRRLEDYYKRQAEVVAAPEPDNK